MIARVTVAWQRQEPEMILFIIAVKLLPRCVRVCNNVIIKSFLYENLLIIEIFGNYTAN